MKIQTALLAVLLFLWGSTAFAANKLSATPASLDFSGTTSSPSPSQSYALKYDNNNHGNITIDVTPSAHTEVSTNNVTWSSTVIAVVVPGDNSATPVYVRVVSATSIMLNETVTNLGQLDPGQTAPVSIVGDVPLPITLASLKLSLLADIPVLTWRTISEIDNYGFYVEKSQDMATWAEVASSFQQGYGTTTETHSYSFTDRTLPIGNYYRLRQVDLDGTSHFSEAVSVIASVNQESMVKEFALDQSYPNPFNPFTNIQYTVGGPGTANTRLVVYDALGREVAVLVNERQAAGRYQARFDGSGLSSGIYYYRLTAGNFTATKRMVLMK